LIDEKLGALKRRSYLDLESLPECAEESHAIEKSAVTIATWKDAVDERTIRVVVQAYRRSSFPGLVGLTQADGFRINREGELSGLSAEELLEFS